MNPPVRQNKDVSFNVLLSTDLKAQLEQLSIECGETKGQVLRKLIAYAFAMRFQAHPICASGRPCLVPHLHVLNPPNLPGLGQG